MMMKETELYKRFITWYNKQNYKLSIEKFEELEFEFQEGIYEKFFKYLGGVLIPQYGIRYKNTFLGFTFYWFKTHDRVFFEDYSKQKLIDYLFNNWKQ